MPVCGNYLFFELPKKIVLNPKDGYFLHYGENKTIEPATEAVQDGVE